MTRKQRRSAAQWAQLVAAYESSDLSKSRYCHEVGIGESTLDKWRRRLKGDARDLDGVRPSAFVRVNRDPDAERVVVQGANGVRILCPMSIGIESITAIAKALNDER